MAILDLHTQGWPNEGAAPAPATGQDSQHMLTDAVAAGRRRAPVIAAVLGQPPERRL